MGPVSPAGLHDRLHYGRRRSWTSRHWWLSTHSHTFLNFVFLFSTILRGAVYVLRATHRHIMESKQQITTAAGCGTSLLFDDPFIFHCHFPINQLHSDRRRWCFGGCNNLISIVIFFKKMIQGLVLMCLPRQHK